MRRNKDKPLPFTHTQAAWGDKWDRMFVDWTQFVIGLVLAGWGAYFLGPWDIHQVTPDAGQAYTPSIIVTSYVAVFEVIVGIGCMVGVMLHSDLISRISLSGTVAAYVGITVLRISTSGPFPFFWSFQFGLAAIAVLLLVRLGLKQNVG